MALFLLLIQIGIIFITLYLNYKENKDLNDWRKRK